MRYRKLSIDGDYTFGNQQADFFIDSPDAVAQAVLTRLELLKGEWYIDTSDGTDYAGSILGKANQITRDHEIKSRILDTPNVVAITQYTSTQVERDVAVSATLTTSFGTTTVSLIL